SVEVGPGDFMGFPTPSVAHHLRNPFDEELVYLSGGERKSMEIADFPRLGKRLLRVGSKVSITSTEGDEPFPGFEPVA
ncbi:MAG: cupin, partial [Myxococcota bacterium]